MDRALSYATTNGRALEKALFEFVSIPSISAQPAYAAEVVRSAEWLRARMEHAGIAARVVSSAGQHPLVIGRSKQIDGAPTVLVYGHHDVQPVDPLSEWDYPPFEPTVVDGVLRCRGGADDKGPTLAMVCAAEAWNRGAGGLPVNVIFAVEGEEESGGHHLADFIREHPDELRADCLVILDVAGFAAGVPALCYGLRGIQTMEIRVDGPSRDLHSGGYGGAVQNPAEVVARLVATLRHPDGSIAVDGLLDDVAEPDAAESARMGELPVDEEAFRAESGAPALFGEPGRGLYERLWSRPTVEVNGIFGGYQGAGSKTIIPAWAGAKLSLRLVPNQDPSKVVAAVKRHLERHCPPTVKLTVTVGHGAAALLTPPAGPWAEKARRAMADAYGVEPKLVRAGGSIPIAQVFHEVLGLPPLLFGTYSPGERAHAPNERYPIADFHSAVRAGIRFFGIA
ncbi:MAG: M20/M25/M40 family metallo-hydrolase [Planctomycetes bacterium]|nr:M20/M25/M40 family metallo-hydrolase [Planctomycetota bacterium]